MTGAPGKPRTLRSDIVFGFVLVLACALAWVLREVLVLMYVSALFAVVLSPVVEATGNLSIGRWRPFKGAAVFFLLLGAAAAVAAFLFLALPPVLRDFQRFAQDMPARMPALLARVKKIPFTESLDTSDLFSQLQGFLSEAATYAVHSISDWAGKLFDVVMGCVMTIYFILEGKHTYAWFLSFFPKGPRGRLDATLQRAKVRMGRWLLGQGSLMLILGLASTIVYLSFHVRYAYALGVLTGILNIVPVLGAAVSIALALLVAAIDSWTSVIAVAVFYVIYLQVESSYLTPRIMRSRVGLPSLAILVALLVGSALAGIVGAMVAVPTAVLVAELVQEYLVNRDAVAGD